MRPWIRILAGALLPITLQAEGNRYVKQHVLPDGRVAVVAEGEMEPRSIGSYSVRLYRRSNPEHPMDDFQGGMIRSRNGAVEKVVVTDINGDRTSDLVIAIRCAGSGGYLSADAISVAQDKPILITNVMDLAPNADIIKALRMSQKTRTKQPAG